MKPKQQDLIITTREDNTSTSSTADARFSLFYENAHDGLYEIIGDRDKNTWKYDNDKNKTDILHLPAENTVFINANIALTDGSSKKFNTDNKTPRTIPNLYDTLSALATKISSIYDRIEVELSTADKYLYVTKDSGLVTISPSTLDETKKNATAVDNTINGIKITMIIH